MTGAYWDFRVCGWVGREPENVVPPHWGRSPAEPVGPLPVQLTPTEAADALSVPDLAAGPLPG